MIIGVSTHDIGIQAEGGLPFLPHEMPIHSFQGLACEGRVVQATPLSVWPTDKSIRWMHLICHPSDNTVNAVRVISGRDREPEALSFNPQKRAVDIMRGFRARLNTHGRYAYWDARKFLSTVYQGPYRWDWDVSGWMKEGSHRYSWLRLYLSYRPYSDPDSVEFVAIHCNMRSPKIGSIDVTEFRLTLENGCHFTQGPGGYAGLPLVDAQRLVTMTNLALPDGGAQVVHGVVTRSGADLYDLYQPLRPADPMSSVGWGEFSGLLPPEQGVYNANLEPSYVHRPLEFYDGRTGQTLRHVVPRPIAGWDHEVSGAESSFPLMKDNLDIPFIVGGTPSHHWRMLLSANCRVEDPGQRGMPPEGDENEWVVWRNPRTDDDYSTGRVNLRAGGSNAPDRDALRAASDRRDFRSGRGPWQRASTHNQHPTLGPQLAAWRATGKPIYREPIVELAECSLSLPAFRGEAPPFSGRAARANLSIAMHAEEADWQIERNLFGWTAEQRESRWWSYASEQVATNLAMSGKYRQDGEWRRLQGYEDVLMFNLAHGQGSDEHKVVPWMDAGAIEAMTAYAVLERQRRRSSSYQHSDVSLSELATKIGATLRFLFVETVGSEGFKYKFDLLPLHAIWDTDAQKWKRVPEGSPGSVVFPPFTAIDDGGDPHPKGNGYYDSASVWVAETAITLAYFSPHMPPALRHAMLQHLPKLVEGYDNNTGGRERWDLPFAAARRIILENNS